MDEICGICMNVPEGSLMDEGGCLMIEKRALDVENV